MRTLRAFDGVEAGMQGTGYLFAPKGYEQDPCLRNRANIDALITGGDSAALQDELAFERSHCRP